VVESAIAGDTTGSPHGNPETLETAESEQSGLGRRSVMKFEWHPLKERLNLQKHGLSFSDASTVFADPCSLSLFDEEHSDEEDRWVTLGMLPNSMMVVVVHTYRVLEAEEYVRLISARRATMNEIRQYQGRLP